MSSLELWSANSIKKYCVLQLDEDHELEAQIRLDDFFLLVLRLLPPSLEDLHYRIVQVYLGELTQPSKFLDLEGSLSALIYFIVRLSKLVLSLWRILDDLYWAHRSCLLDETLALS